MVRGCCHTSCLAAAAAAAATAADGILLMAVLLLSRLHLWSVAAVVVEDVAVAAVAVAVQWNHRLAGAVRLGAGGVGGCAWAPSCS